jgi:hypothetical protein
VAHRGTLSTGGSSEQWERPSFQLIGNVHLVPGTLTPAPETAAPTTGRPPETILQQPAGTTNASQTGRKTVPSHAPTASGGN